MIRGLERATHEFELVTSEFELVTRGFELVTRGFVDVIDVVLVPLLVILNRFYALLCCFHC